ncbi:AAA family ATPase [Candidatus Berkelbacteria bacterium CG08_land_8_20_14_0_20_39_8]|uniref:Replication-associated recombination protein A n=1 Tax=Candidatus Berkelbacteria bacterium CG08_land_8_20_14_0_20_39_8 TaxID=1974511 RepID=A0A2M6YC67_9BACT|nr:MAG: AAA family ATPase [Candidatus Berkelbacteria bacterium CG08_land_8_20_14_0_20_39_8]
MTDLFDRNLVLGAPLADRMRPENFSDYIGQKHILAPDKILRKAIDADKLFSMILWGPPGSGKTTLACLISKKTKSFFQPFSAVTSGISDVRKALDEAKTRKKFHQQKTVLFVDEIHHFNKTQQDAFLPTVENGTIILIGATTENPSFQVNAPLLSRARVFHLRELSEDDIIKLLKTAIKDKIRGFAKLKIKIDAAALRHIAKLSEGDARDAYNALELAIVTAKKDNFGTINITTADAEEAIQAKFIRYDKSADGHFDVISALHKSVRASDIDASLHYLARMIEAGEEPLYIIRRLMRAASEDIGMADPFALMLASATQQTISFMGMPEASDALAELTIYLAKAKKSRAVDSAYTKAVDDIKNLRLDPIPLDIRNAPTKMMKDFGFGKGYEPYKTKDHRPKNLHKRKYWHDETN